VTDLRARACRPVDAASLAAVRIAFGLLMVVAMARYFLHGWIAPLFVAPTFFFSYEGLAWMRPWPGPGMYVHFAALGLLALGIAIGWRSRACALLFGFGFTYVHLIDKTNYLNHYYLISLLAFLLAALPVHRPATVEGWRRPARRRDVVPAWAVWLVRAQLGIVYFFGGVAKLHADWLLRAQPLTAWLGASGDVPLVGPWLTVAWVPAAASVAAAVFDLAIVFLLLARRTRGPAYAAVVGFHVLTAGLFPIGMFPWVMLALTPVFFAPDWPRRVASRVTGVRRTGAPGAAGPPSFARWPLVPAVLYLALQVVVPLRAVGAPGDVLWTESGFRFAWRVMVMEKNGAVTFRVRDRATGARWRVEPRTVLTPLQTRMMATQPDMILAFAHHLAARARAAGHAHVAVYADAWVSLNGRPSQRFVRPEIDLLGVDPRAPRPLWLAAPLARAAPEAQAAETAGKRNTRAVFSQVRRATSARSRSSVRATISAT
jgi:hypothetical protein